ncbi:SPX and EXS domain-containing protein [Tanacetum coccineum]
MEKEDPAVVTKSLANNYNEFIEKLSSQSSIHANAEANANIEMGGPAIATGSDNSREGNGDKVSFASLLKKPMPSKAVRLSMMKNAKSVIGANVAIPLPAVEEVSKRFENTLYGYFIGKRLAFPVVENYVKNAWEKFGLECTMLSNGFFFFQFSSRDGMERVLENGPWLIRLVPIILNIWTPNTRLKKETITSAPIWVKLHNVPIMAYSEIGLSLITSQIRNPIMLDAYTSMMCQKSWGRNSYARALVEVSSLNPLQDSLVVAIPFPDGSGHSSLDWNHIEVEFQVEDDGFTKVNNSSLLTSRALIDRLLPPKHAEKENLVSLSNSFETLNEFKDGPPIKKVYGSTIVDNLLSDDEEDKENVYDETINASAKNVSKGASIPSQEVFKRWNWTSNSLSCMKSSRVIMGWNPDILNVVVIASDDQVMHTCVLFKADKKEVFCSVVYAHNNYIHRRALWKNLKTHKGYVRGRPWVVLGDFNVSPSSYIDTGMCDFQECVEDIEVMDVNSTGLKFTWNQKPKGDSGLLKKIDRIMSNLEFMLIFVGVLLVFPPYRTSDHAPAVLRIPMNSMKRPHALSSSTCMSVDEAQKDLDSDPSNVELREEEAAYLHAYQDAILMEERLLVQKAKIDWLKT